MRFLGCPIAFDEDPER
jgi:hypothetical protein